MSVVSQFSRGFSKKVAVAAIVATLIVGGSVPVLADKTTVSGVGVATANVPIKGTINATTISVTVPDSAAYSINPDTNTFTSPALAITNHTAAPVDVSIKSLTADTSGTTADVMPGDVDWSKLTATNSYKYLALGASVKDSTGWTSGYNTNTYWAASHTVMDIGDLASGATGNVELSAEYGHAFQNTITPTGAIVFSVSLANS